MWNAKNGTSQGFQGTRISCKVTEHLANFTWARHRHKITTQGTQNADNFVFGKNMKELHAGCFTARLHYWEWAGNWWWSPPGPPLTAALSQSLFPWWVLPPSLPWYPPPAFQLAPPLQLLPGVCNNPQDWVFSFGAQKGKKQKRKKRMKQNETKEKMLGLEQKDKIWKRLVSDKIEQMRTNESGNNFGGTYWITTLNMKIWNRTIHACSEFGFQSGLKLKTHQAGFCCRSFFTHHFFFQFNFMQWECTHLCWVFLAIFWKKKKWTNIK